MRITPVADVATLQPVDLAAPQPIVPGEPPAPDPRPWAAWAPLSDPTPQPSARVATRWQWLDPYLSRERRPLTVGLLFSLLIHAVVLSLNLGAEGLGLPGRAFAWRDQRIEVPDIRIVLVPAPARITPEQQTGKPAAQPPRTTIESPIAAAPAAKPTPPVKPAPPAKPKPNAVARADAAAPMKPPR